MRKTVKENSTPFITVGKLRKKENYKWPFAVVVSHMTLLVGRYIYCFIWLEGKVVSSHPLYLLLAALLPFVVWSCTTMVEEYNYSLVKRGLLMTCIVNAVLTIIQPLWGLIYRVLVMRILQIRITEAMTHGMVLNLARIVLLLGMALAFFIVFAPLHSIFTNAQMAAAIDTFKLDHEVDLRPNRKVAYDINIMRDVKGFGSMMPLYQDDMLTHLLLVGPSGTGKTSSSIIPMLICLLRRKIENREKREILLLKLVNEKKAYVRGPVANPTEYDIVPFEKYEKEVESIYKQYPDCGITFVSPNESIGNDVVKLCKDCGVGVNMLDPTKIYTEENVRMVGMKPFFVPFGLSEEDRAVMIVNQAKIFSETLITVNEASSEGGGEQYFRDLNTSVTSNIAIICMLWRNLRGEQTSIGEIQECINEFELMYPMLVDINAELGLNIAIVDPKKLQEDKNNRGKKGSKVGEIDTEGLANLLRKGDGQEETDWSDEETKDYAENGYLSSSDHSDENIRAYRFAVEYVNKELFINGEKMFDQARGLRNLMNDMLFNPQVYRILNGGDEFIDIDRALSRCEVTVVDTAIRIGQQTSTALGLFFLLNHKRAVLRRPENDRQLHFLIVDEATQYVHPWMEDAIGLYRQYVCSCTFSFQSLAQLEKTNRTKYIKGILLTVGNIIVYGRVGEEEMKTFETMGGSRKIMQVQKQSNKTSILADTPSATVGNRMMEVDESFVSSSDLRMRSFQEVTWIGTIKGDVQYARIAKLSFAKKDSFEDKGIEVFDWSPFVVEDGVVPLDEAEETVVKKMEEIKSDKVELDPVYDKAVDEDLFSLEQEHAGGDSLMSVLPKEPMEKVEIDEGVTSGLGVITLTTATGDDETEGNTFLIASESEDEVPEKSEGDDTEGVNLEDELFI